MKCQIVKKMSSCQKDVKCQNVKMSNIWTMGEVHKKIYITRFTDILMLILTSHMKVITISQKYFLWTFWGFLMTITSDVKIDVNMCEPHYVNLFTYGAYTDRPPEWICHFLIFLKGSYFHTFYQMHICVRSKNNIYSHAQMKTLRQKCVCINSVLGSQI